MYNVAQGMMLADEDMSMRSIIRVDNEWGEGCYPTSKVHTNPLGSHIKIGKSNGFLIASTWNPEVTNDGVDEAYVDEDNVNEVQNWPPRYMLRIDSLGMVDDKHESKRTRPRTGADICKYVDEM